MHYITMSYMVEGYFLAGDRFERIRKAAKITIHSENIILQDENRCNTIVKHFFLDPYGKF
jgi:hypothetical protein